MAYCNAANIHLICTGKEGLLGKWVCPLQPCDKVLDKKQIIALSMYRTLVITKGNCEFWAFDLHECKATMKAVLWLWHS